MQALLRASEIDFSVSGSIFDEGRPCWGQSPAPMRATI